MKKCFCGDSSPEVTSSLLICRHHSATGGDDHPETKITG